MMNFKFYLLLLLIITNLTACGTIFSGTKSMVEFQSIPPGANVEVDNKKGVTPCSIIISKKTKNYKIHKDGYHSEYIDIDKRVSALALLDFFFFCAPLAGDYITGGLWVIDPKQLVYLKELSDNNNDINSSNSDPNILLQ